MDFNLKLKKFIYLDCFVIYCFVKREVNLKPIIKVIRNLRKQ